MTCRLSLGGFREVMFRMFALWPLRFLPRQISSNGMRSKDRGSHTGVRLHHEHALFHSNFFLFLNLIKSRTAPAPCCSLRPTAVAGVNWDNCVVWGWAMPVQLFVSWGNRVAHGFHRDFEGSGVLGMYPGTVAVVPKLLPSCWILCVVFCQQALVC